ncbi:hypothetical protein CHARACLAT_020817 [Characodon lateralis]|uniref:Uncharacterized protein n=1 Tax=Characodon lateralis TaxID=208331 RepID=A0ABU7DV24_9TELE|nr:hypothetical protein [Characodon lateralis]
MATPQTHYHCPVQFNSIQKYFINPKGKLNTQFCRQQPDNPGISKIQVDHQPEDGRTSVTEVSGAHFKSTWTEKVPTKDEALHNLYCMFEGFRVSLSNINIRAVQHACIAIQKDCWVQVLVGFNISSALHANSAS